MYTLDTNAIIYHLKGDPQAVSFFASETNTADVFYVSTITELELFSLPDLKVKDASDLDTFLKTTSVIPVDSRIARIAAFLRRTYRTRTADSVIAATALFTNTPLVTRNIKDFQNINNLSLQSI